jgi:uncharacterized alkaline shock family protein YloU
MSIKSQNEIGEISIEHDVLASIAALAAMECYGLVGMTYKSARNGIAKMLKGEHLAKGVEVRAVDEGVEIDLYVIIQYGTKISVVAENILEKVKYQVETQTGIAVKEVNLNIEGVRVQE